MKRRVMILMAGAIGLSLLVLVFRYPHQGNHPPRSSDNDAHPGMGSSSAGAAELRALSNTPSNPLERPIVPRPRRIAGIVFLDDRRPAGDGIAVQWRYRKGRWIDGAVTRHGLFEFMIEHGGDGCLDAGEIELMARAEDGNACSSVVQVPTGEIGVVYLFLRGVTTIVGRAVDESCTPVPGAIVWGGSDRLIGTVRSGWQHADAQRLWVSSVTDEVGRFRMQLRSAVPGRVVACDGEGDLSRIVEFSGGDSGSLIDVGDLVISARCTSRWDLRFVSSDGSVPVGGAFVKLPTDLSWAEGLVGTGESGSEGGLLYADDDGEISLVLPKGDPIVVGVGSAKHMTSQLRLDCSLERAAADCRLRMRPSVTVEIEGGEGVPLVWDAVSVEVRAHLDVKWTEPMEVVDAVTGVLREGARGYYPGNKLRMAYGASVERVGRKKWVVCTDGSGECGMELRSRGAAVTTVRFDVAEGDTASDRVVLLRIPDVLAVKFDLGNLRDWVGREGRTLGGGYWAVPVCGGSPARMAACELADQYGHPLDDRIAFVPAETAEFALVAGDLPVAISGDDVVGTAFLSGPVSDGPRDVVVPFPGRRSAGLSDVHVHVVLGSEALRLRGVEVLAVSLENRRRVTTALTDSDGVARLSLPPGMYAYGLDLVLGSQSRRADDWPTFEVSRSGQELHVSIHAFEER